MILTHLTALGHPVPLVDGYGYRLTTPFHVEVTPHPKRASHDKPDPQRAKQWIAELVGPPIVARVVEYVIDSDPQRALDELIRKARAARRGFEEF